MNSFVSLLKRIFRFYYEGFTTMSWWGKRIWTILLIKLFIIFLILKLFFFPISLKRITGQMSSAANMYWNN